MRRVGASVYRPACASNDPPRLPETLHSTEDHMHPYANPADLPFGCGTDLSPDEAAALLRDLHDLAQNDHPEDLDPCVH